MVLDDDFLLLDDDFGEDFDEVVVLILVLILG